MVYQGKSNIMKTLPYLKQMTYASIILAFPFIFSASRDTALPPPVDTPKETSRAPETPVKVETIRTIKQTVDSLKNSGKTLLYPQTPTALLLKSSRLQHPSC